MLNRDDFHWVRLPLHPVGARLVMCRLVDTHQWERPRTYWDVEIVSTGEIVQVSEGAIGMPITPLELLAHAAE